MSYDGTKLCQLETALPQLERHGLRGTFYADSAPLMQHAHAWIEAQSRGHEIGNGTLLAAALPDGSLPAWTPKMIVDDIELAEDLLGELFPSQREHSFAYPIGMPRCADGNDYSPEVMKLGMVARSGVVGYNRLGADARYLRCIPAYEMNGEDLIACAEQAVKRNLVAVFAFVGVGAGEFAVDAKAHEEFCAWLSDNRDRVTLDTVTGVAEQTAGVRTSRFRLA